MRSLLPLIALLLTTAAAAQQSPPEPAAPDATALPDALVLSPEWRVEGRNPCRDRIHQVRQERGLPVLRRESAAPDEPLLIAAVDHRIDGCSVMVMRNDTSDVRPLPPMPDEPARVRRIQ